MEVVMVLFVLGTASFVFSSLAKAKKTDKLQSIGVLLGGGTDKRGRAWGKALGAMAELHFTTRGSGSSSETWTEIEVEVPGKYPLSMMIRRHAWLDAGKIESGAMVDVQVGDVAFDEAFLVEAAPADVVRKLLTPEVRAQLFALPRFQLVTLPHSSALRLELRGWIEPEVVGTAVTMLAQISNGLRSAYAEVEAESQPVVAGSPFRQEIDDRPARQAAAAREAEVANVQRMRDARQRHPQVIGAAICIGVMIVFLLLLLK